MHPCVKQAHGLQAAEAQAAVIGATHQLGKGAERGEGMRGCVNACAMTAGQLMAGAPADGVQWRQPESR